MIDSQTLTFELRSALPLSINSVYQSALHSLLEYLVFGSSDCVMIKGWHRWRRGI